MMLILRENQQELDSSVLPKQLLMNSSTLKQSEMKCHSQQQQQKAEKPQQTKQGLVSHVPVSIGSWIPSRQSSSTLSSLSSSEGSDSAYPPSCHTSVTENTETKRSSATERSTSAQDSMQIPKIREISVTKKRHFKKAFIAAADKCKNESAADCESPPLVILRPSKKTRNASIESTAGSPLATGTTDTGCSSSAEAPPRCFSLPLHERKPQEKSNDTLLLGQDEDDLHLNPLHVFVRKQTEVFTATQTELTEPAPGRKQPIKLHQVGLRCIHCRNAPARSRVKRAVCYPSSVSRIYHSISDMKFDHFGHCKHLPPEVRKTFEILKAESKASNGNKDKKGKSSSNKKGASYSSTAQYYRESASRMGLVDGTAGIVYEGLTNNPSPDSPTVPTPNLLPLQPLQSLPTTTTTITPTTTNSMNTSVANAGAMVSTLFPQRELSSLFAANSNGSNIATESDFMNLAVAMKSGILQSLLMNAIVAGANAQKSIDAAAKASAKSQEQDQQNKNKTNKNKTNNNNHTANNTRSNHSPEQKVHGQAHAQQTSNTRCLLTKNRETCAASESTTLPLASPEDATFLNPLHCFVRQHVELFEANAEDISAPAPGRKTRVALGQVGIRCVHCAKRRVPSKERVKRSVCYPPSIDGIYHSVSNMKFDHFGICPHLPCHARAELAALRTSCSGRRHSSGSSSGGSGKRGPGSTATAGTNTADYYRDAAVAKGLVDTDKGIRFDQPVSKSMPMVPAPLLPTAAASFPTGMSALMMAAASHATCI